MVRGDTRVLERTPAGVLRAAIPPSRVAALLALAAWAVLWCLPGPAGAKVRRDVPTEVETEPATALAEEALPASERLDRGRQAYENADFQKALEEFGRIDAMGLGREQRKQLHEMMGKCRFIAGDREGAEAEFFEILKLDPDFRMDPVRTSRDIEVLFEVTRTTRGKDLRLFPVEPERTIPGWRVPKVAAHNMFVAFAPAGVFRLAFLRTPKLGVAMLSAQLVPIITSGASYGYLLWAQNDNCNAVVVNAAPVVQVVNIVSFIAAVSIYAVGIVDAFLSQRYHGRAPGGVKRNKVANGWRWGPPPPIPALAD